MHSLLSDIFDNVFSPVAEVLQGSSTEFLYCLQGAEHYYRVAKQGHRMDITVPDFKSHNQIVLHCLENILPISNYNTGMKYKYV